MKYTSKFLNYFLLVVIAVLVYTRLTSGRAISKYDDPLASVFKENNPGKYCDGTVFKNNFGVGNPYICVGGPVRNIGDTPTYGKIPVGFFAPPPVKPVIDNRKLRPPRSLFWVNRNR